MKTPDTRTSKQILLTCLSCGQEFLSYQTAGRVHCPHCGRPVHLARYRRILRWAALGLAVILLIVAIFMLKGD